MTAIAGILVTGPIAHRDMSRGHAKGHGSLIQGLAANRKPEGWGCNAPKVIVLESAKLDHAKADAALVLAWLKYTDRAAGDAVPR